MIQINVTINGMELLALLFGIGVYIGYKLLEYGCSFER